MDKAETSSPPTDACRLRREAEVLVGITEILSEVAGVDPAKVREESTFRDLGVDSLTLITVFLEAERRFEVAVPDYAVIGLVRVADLVDRVASLSAGVGVNTNAENAEPDRGTGALSATTGQTEALNDGPPGPRSLVEHARHELELLGQFVEDQAFAQSIVAALSAFASYGHSGGSAAVAVDLMCRLLRREPLTPITSDPAEWVDRSEMSGRPWWQNRRDSRAMSHDGGATWWYVEGRLPGERCLSGDDWGVLEQCGVCSGSGVLHRPDDPQSGAGPLQHGRRQT
jgi:acyl carrier protein